MPKKELPLDDIVVDRSISVRLGDLDRKTLETYRENLDVLPPVDVFIGDEIILAAGFHRFEAHRLEGREKITAEIHKGDRNAALEFAATADIKHGRPLSREEKAESVRRLSDLHPDWNRDELATTLSLTAAFVRGIQVENEVRAATSNMLKPSYYKEIHRASRKHWKPLAEAALGNDWSVQETRAAVDRLRDRTTPEEVKEGILTGSQEPYVLKDDEPAYLAETVARRSSESERINPMKPLRDAILAVEVFQDRHVDEMWEDLDKKEVERLAESIKRAQGILDEAHEKLVSQLDRLQAVA